MTEFISQGAKIYANALIGLNADKNTIINDLTQIIEVIEQSDDLRAILSNSSVNFNKKKEILSEIFGGKIDEKLINFLYILTEKNKINLLGEILKSFEQISAENSGISVVEIISATELNQDYKNRIIQKLEQKLDKKVQPYWNIEPEIIGGLIFKIGDTVIDSSLKNKIENFSKVMK
ncbi:ATP synthase F1 subunit delta [bacterium]|nr:ATP synthase F1 subunit delta [bacterium]